MWRFTSSKFELMNIGEEESVFNSPRQRGKISTLVRKQCVIHFVKV